LVGTTDTPVDDVVLEPQPLASEITFLLEHAARYLAENPRPDDVRSVFAGLRPLVSSEGPDNTAALSRDHTLDISPSGLITIAGGKWTTYRRMAEDTVDHAAVVAGLPAAPCTTHELPIHGHWPPEAADGHLAVHGADAPALRRLANSEKGLDALVHPRLPTLRAEVVWAARHEMARTVDDVLARRTRALILDARAAAEASDAVAGVLGEALGRDRAWAVAQASAFQKMAMRYLP
jgi:glycerol-3-phosphate dehydrogenase